MVAGLVVAFFLSTKDARPAAPSGTPLVGGPRLLMQDRGPQRQAGKTDGQEDARGHISDIGLQGQVHILLGGSQRASTTGRHGRQGLVTAKPRRDALLGGRIRSSFVQQNVAQDGLD